MIILSMVSFIRVSFHLFPPLHSQVPISGFITVKQAGLSISCMSLSSLCVYKWAQPCPTYLDAVTPTKEGSVFKTDTTTMFSSTSYTTVDLELWQVDTLWYFPPCALPRRLPQQPNVPFENVPAELDDIFTVPVVPRLIEVEQRENMGFSSSWDEGSLKETFVVFFDTSGLHAWETVFSPNAPQTLRENSTARIKYNGEKHIAFLGLC